jgi:hypothetical protein
MDLFNITTTEAINLGLLALVLGVALIYIVHAARAPESDKSKDDGSSYYVG